MNLLKYGCVVEVCVAVCLCPGMSIYTWGLIEYYIDDIFVGWDWGVIRVIAIWEFICMGRC